MRISRKLTHRVLALSALILSLAIAGWQAPTLLAYSHQMVKAVRTKFDRTPAKPEVKAAAATVAMQQTKEQKHARMKELVAQIAAVKGQPGQQATLNSAMAELKQISDSLGGDLPANEGPSAPSQTAVRVIPPAPAGCTLSNTTATQSTPTAIPTGPAVVTSTLVVAGAGPYLWDVDLTTNLTHTFAADLDITIQSPAGTVVTLTTDNGAGNDNVFNGTLWDDQANPAGQVPYVTNNGLVTDHAYVNLTTATPLVPEEALSAFRGENPNGTWTITISDDLAGDGGSLDSWSVALSTLPAAPMTATASFTQSTPTAIPTGPAVVSSTVAVAVAGNALSNVRLTTNLTHTFAADLDITIQSPAGTVVTLTTDNGAGNDNVFNGTLWDDKANPAGQVPYTTNDGVASDHAYVNLTTATPLVPEEAMGAFSGENPNGTWTITISDDLAGDGGSLDSWTLEVTTMTCALPCMITCPANQVAWTAGTTAVVNYPAPTTAGGGCGTVTCTPPSGGSFNVGTTTVTCSTTAGPSCSFTVTVNRLALSQSGMVNDPLVCIGPGDKSNLTFTMTNTSGASATVSGTVALTNVVVVAGMTSATVAGTLTSTPSSVTWTGTLAAGASVTVSYMVQFSDTAPPNSVASVVLTATANGLPVEGSSTISAILNCAPVGPGGILPATSEASDQKMGSVLIYNIYTSGATSGNTQNTRINITNTHPSRPSFVHLFFVAESCAVADSYICLTATQTASFLASDLDPGTTGYLVAVAVNQIGCPTSFNYLIGDEYVKFTAGHAANLGAIAFSQLAGGLPGCNDTSNTAQINFDGVSYNRTPATLALDNVGSRADGNDTLLILNRIGGNLGIGAASLGTLFGIFYDDAENALSFSVTGGCQLRNSITNNFPRITPRFETFVPAGRSGWLKVFNQTGAIGITGAAINFNPNASSSAGAFNQGHNLHHLTLNNQMNYIIPVFPPSC